MRYSVLIPCYNEEENLPSLLQEISSIMHQMEGDFEVIVIDDASTDGTFDVVSAIIPTMPQLRILQLASRAGQSGALCVGIREAQGALIITIDGDGQNNPEDIPLLISALNGFDCVCGRRESRHDSWGKKLWSKVANGIRRFALKDPIQDAGCALKIFTSSSIRSVPFFIGMHRFLSSLFIIYGFSVKEILVSHRPRLKGFSKYSLFNRAFCSLYDLVGVMWLKQRRISTHIAKRLP